jgi:hypothetical protein
MPVPGNLIRGVKPLERAEELVRIDHVKAGTVVTHEIHWGTLLIDGTELDLGFRLTAREFPRVSDQILERHAHERSVADSNDSWSDIELHFPLRVDALQFRRNGPRERTQVDHIATHFLPRNPRQHEQGVDERTSVAPPRERDANNRARGCPACQRSPARESR